MTLRIITTGGTFDKCYDPLAGLLGFTQSLVPALLAPAHLAQTPVIEPLMAIDSLHMRDEHRAAIVAACRQSKETGIVIVHGTDTMVETATALALAALPATIVLTGAMVPASIERSDAAFNLGFAVASAQMLPAGVWIAMNGRAHAWNRVRKNRALGCFEPIL